MKTCRLSRLNADTRNSIFIQSYMNQQALKSNKCFYCRGYHLGYHKEYLLKILLLHTLHLYCKFPFHNPEGGPSVSDMFGSYKEDSLSNKCFYCRGCTIKNIIKIEDVIFTYVTFVLQISFPQPRRWHVSDIFGSYTEDSLSRHKPINIISNRGVLTEISR